MNGIDSKEEYTGLMLPQVRITTDRLLSAATTDMVLNALAQNETILSHVRRFDIKGENLPKTINNGPHRGIENNHSERRLIRFGNSEFELTKAVGDFFLELLVKDEEEMNAVVEEIKSVCIEVVPFGYALTVGRYTKYRSTISDY